MKNTIEPGTIIVCNVIEDGIVTVSLAEYDVVIGTITKENWTWLGKEDIVPQDKINLVVLDQKGLHGLINFGRKHLISLEEVVTNSSNEELVQYLYELQEVREQLIKVTNELANIHDRY